MSKPISDGDLAELELLSRVTSALPWLRATSCGFSRVVQRDHSSVFYAASLHDGCMHIEGSNVDWEYFIKAVNAVPGLIARLRQAEAPLDLAESIPLSCRDCSVVVSAEEAVGWRFDTKNGWRCTECQGD